MEFLKRDRIDRHIANWEMNSDTQLQNNKTSEQIDQMKNQREAYLNLRRKKLSEMLMYEDSILKKEILQSQDNFKRKKWRRN